MIPLTHTMHSTVVLYCQSQHIPIMSVTRQVKFRKITKYDKWFTYDCFSFLLHKRHNTNARYLFNQSPLLDLLQLTTCVDKWNGFVTCHLLFLTVSKQYTKRKALTPSKENHLRTSYFFRFIKRLVRDWLIELRFYIPPDTKQVILETFFPANLLA